MNKNSSYKLVSLVLQAQFGFLKKPDINEGIYLTYTMLHKPALLGILGAILGLGGYKIEGTMKPDEVPEYRQNLENIKVAVQPINSSNGNFSKQVIRYTNTVGYASEEQGGVLIVDEQTLIKPQYRVFFLIDIESNQLHNQLYSMLKNQEAEYIPYLGKNEHQLWWNCESFIEWTILDDDHKSSENFRINSIFQKPSEERIKREERRRGLGGMTFGTFVYFERLPIGWQAELPHYRLQEFIYTDFPVSPENGFENLLRIKNQEEELVIQIF
jgi:CRISPR-associated protein Cas5h